MKNLSSSFSVKEVDRVRLHWCKASGLVETLEAQTRRSVVYLFPSVFLSVYVPPSPSCSITLSLSAVFPCQIFPFCCICGCCRYYEHLVHKCGVSKKIVLLFSKDASH